MRKKCRERVKSMMVHVTKYDGNQVTANDCRQLPSNTHLDQHCLRSDLLAGNNGAVCI